MYGLGASFDGMDLYLSGDDCSTTQLLAVGDITISLILEYADSWYLQNRD